MQGNADDLLIHDAPARVPGMALLNSAAMREVSPQWAALSDRCKELSDRRDAICEDMRTARISPRKWNARRPMSLDVGDTSARNIVVPPKPPKPPSAQALELLGGLAPPAPEPVEPAAPKVVYQDPITARLAVLADELTAIEEALKLLYPQLEKARREASIKLCEKVRPQYSAVAARLAAALIGAGEALLAHNEFTAELKATGCESAFLRQVDAPSVSRWFGDPRDRDDALRRFLSWAVEAGHFDLASIPAAWVAPRASAPAAAIVAPRESAPNTTPAPAGADGGAPVQPAAVTRGRLADRVRAALRS